MADMAEASTPLLRVEHVSMRFGGLTAVGDLSFDARQSEITALIGPNGAGKTTVFNCITGFYKPTEGAIILTHEDGTRFQLERMDDFRITQRAKVARTFQNIRLFSGMTVLENLMVAQHNTLMVASGYTVGGIFNTAGYQKASREAVEFSRHWLEKTGLVDRADDPAGDLPYGDQRRLEIARAMCTKPKLLCLDEPAAGLNPRESDALNKLLLSIRADEKIAILLIEHDMSVVMGISDHIVVLDYGVKISDGSPSHVRNDPAVIRAYLGVEDEEEADIAAPIPALAEVQAEVTAALEHPEDLLHPHAPPLPEPAAKAKAEAAPETKKPAARKTPSPVTKKTVAKSVAKKAAAPAPAKPAAKKAAAKKPAAKPAAKKGGRK